VNDLGGSKPDSADATATQLMEAYKQFIARGHERGLRVYGATMLPFGGSFYDAPERSAARQRVNNWIRRSRAFDAVIDFDAALRDPANPSRLRGDVDSGDHLHPNENGYRLMAEAIDLKLFRNNHQ
jgi:lysophospholipase L1-like esterase